MDSLTEAKLVGATWSRIPKIELGNFFQGILHQGAQILVKPKMA